MVITFTFAWAASVVNILLFLQCIIRSDASPSKRLERRDPAIVTSPSRGYAPSGAQCPENLISTWNGQAQLSGPEQTYIKEKAAKSIQLWREYLTRVNLADFDVEKFLSKAITQGGVAAQTLPNFGFAMSGGGARALCVGASVLEAFDSRSPRGNEAKIGGLLQLANYATGASGGGWLLGGWGASNFPLFSTLNQTLWRLTEENDLWDWHIAKHYWKVFTVVREKKKAGFPVSIVDAWGRLLSRHFIDDPTEEDPKQGRGVLWSSIRETPGYKGRSPPFVIVVATTRPAPKQAFLPDNPTYEFTTEDFNVFHPRLNASIPIEYLGSQSPSPTGGCVRGFDNAGFVMGMSSNIFSIADSPKTDAEPPLFLRALEKFLDGDDFEGKVPNTFKGLGTSDSYGSFSDSSREMLLMADSGLISENIPLQPLLLPARQLDVIIALDSSGDGKHFGQSEGEAYPNGTSIYMMYAKTTLPSYPGYPMPKIPNAIDGTFAKLGYHKRPTVFGCNAKVGTPMIIYLPNYYAVAYTAVSSGTSTYSGEQINQFFENGFAIASQTAGPNIDPEWPACLACFLINAQLRRDSTPPTSQCQKCFVRYCAKED